jgi:PKD repeat protein
VVKYHWDFGDGVALDGAEVTHAYTQPGTYTLQIVATGLNAVASSKNLKTVITGDVSTTFVPRRKNGS